MPHSNNLHNLNPHFRSLLLNNHSNNPQHLRSSFDIGHLGNLDISNNRNVSNNFHIDCTRDFKLDNDPYELEDFDECGDESDD